MTDLFDDVPEKAYRDPVVWLGAGGCFLGLVLYVALYLAGVREDGWYWYVLALLLVVSGLLAAAERNHRRHRRRDMEAAMRAALQSAPVDPGSARRASRAPARPGRRRRRLR